MPKTKKGQTLITVYPDWCKGCGICVAFCPSKVLELDETGKAIPARPEDCINCGFCERHCPDFAIAISPKPQTPAQSETDNPSTESAPEQTEPAKDEPAKSEDNK